MKINRRVGCKINKPLSGSMVFRLIMSLAERLSTKTSCFLSRLCFSAEFWTLSADISAPPSLERNVKPGQLPRYNPGISVAKKYSQWNRASSIILHGRKQILCVDSSKILKNLVATSHPPLERAISRDIKKDNNNLYK